jgi:hypothetical protein
MEYKPISSEDKAPQKNLPEEIDQPDDNNVLPQTDSTNRIKTSLSFIVKKIGNRFFDFFMLFLAVFCGFLAENFREQLSDNQREKVYIRSIVEDIKSDTLESKRILLRLIDRYQGLDSAMKELMNPDVLNYSNKLARLWVENIGIDFFVSNDRTIKQLKNSGDLRLIRNRAVSDRIMNYDQIVTKYYTQTDVMLNALTNWTKDAQILDFTGLLNNKGAATPLLLQDKISLNQFYSHIYLWNRALSGLISWLQVVNAEARDSLLFIKKEYHID